MTESVIILTVTGAIAYIALLWIIITFILSFAGGWHRLASTFRTDRQETGDIFTFISGRFRFVNYNYILRVAVSHDGMYLSLFKFFRPFHPPLFIPWQAVRSTVRQNIFWEKYIRLEIKDIKGTVNFFISEKAAASPFLAGRLH
jgi:hypothetical protein